MGKSSSTISTRRTKKKSKREFQVNAYNRVVGKVGGPNAASELQQIWEHMDRHYGGLEWGKYEGVVIGLINQGLSQCEIKALLGVGGYRINMLG